MPIYDKPRRPEASAASARFRRVFGLCLVSVITLIISSSYPRPALEAAVQPRYSVATAGDRPTPLTRHVLLISLDGLRPEAIDRFGATTIQRLKLEGSYAPTAETVELSRTLPAHASMLSGVEPRVHGMTWNREEPGDLQLPTIFDLATQAGLETAAFFSKTKLEQLTGPGDVHHLTVRSRWSLIDWDADHTADVVIDYLEHGHKPNLLFVHIAEPDQTGHDEGWMSEEYGEAVRQVDRALADLLTAADTAFGVGQYTVILTADHGGVGHGHRIDDPRSTSIPWVTWGKAVACGKKIPRVVRTTDTAATVAWLLNLNAPRYWTGRPVKRAYREKPAADRVLNRFKFGAPDSCVR